MKCDNGMTFNDWNVLGKRDPMWAILSDPSKKDNRWNVNEFFDTGKNHIAFVMDEMRRKKMISKYSKALDFGCGIGRLTQPLSEYFNECVGVDIAQSMVRNARKFNMRKNCTFVQIHNSFFDFFQNDEFDFIYSILVLQHILPEHTKNFLREFMRILKPGGLAVFQLPSHLSAYGDSLLQARSNVAKINKDSGLYWSKIKKFIFKDRMPAIRMYGVHKDKVVSYIKDSGGEMIEIQNDPFAGMEWVSFTYYVRKAC